MDAIPAVPPDSLNAERGFQADQRWHRSAFAILPPRSATGNCSMSVVAEEASPPMEPEGWNVTGIDISPKNVEALRRRGFDSEVVDLNGDFPFLPETFTCVSFIEVAEHLVRAEHAFHEVSRVLTPGGKVLFTTPNIASYRRRLKALKGRAPDDEGYHFRFWVKEQLERKWEEAGLRVTATASYGYLPFVDTMTLYKARSGKRRVFTIGKRWEAIFADRFVWLLAKKS